MHTHSLRGDNCKEIWSEYYQKCLESELKTAQLVDLDLLHSKRARLRRIPHGMISELSWPFSPSKCALRALATHSSDTIDFWNELKRRHAHPWSTAFSVGSPNAKLTKRSEERDTHQKVHFVTFYSALLILLFSFCTELSAHFTRPILGVKDCLSTRKSRSMAYWSKTRNSLKFLRPNVRAVRTFSPLGLCQWRSFACVDIAGLRESSSHSHSLSVCSTKKIVSFWKLSLLRALKKRQTLKTLRCPYHRQAMVHG